MLKRGNDKDDDTFICIGFKSFKNNTRICHGVVVVLEINL